MKLRAAYRAMFPTGVGMNRTPLADPAGAEHVPHGRGDEPQYQTEADQSGQCSPRAWG